MDDGGTNPYNSGTSNEERCREPTRTRWNPKPEQIMILDSIFNSGMVNPPKEETVRIRRLLERFGPVGDANVFYWFQNRRSRSRRRQRQIQAASVPPGGSDLSNHQNQQSQSHGGAIIQYGEGSSSAACAEGYVPFNDNYYHHYGSLTSNYVSSSSTDLFGSSSSGGDVGAENFLVPGQAGFPVTDPSSGMGMGMGMGMFSMYQSDTLSLPRHSGNITVFMNGVPTHVPACPIEVKAVFGENAIVVQSSGVPLPMNEYGFLMESLKPGQSYFLVQR
ncbi:hypothetical protein SAY86_015789 [Trapa natans]|uniref:Homeobox domain-containing protein n=1 Tax=Trapa natans TaxID=22666 RepID=A0AAN7LKC0_TRANT|nr:hypothetical protein SAY86_015789 [Trapa natans]